MDGLAVASSVEALRRHYLARLPQGRRAEDKPDTRPSRSTQRGMSSKLRWVLQVVPSPLFFSLRSGPATTHAIPRPLPRRCQQCGALRRATLRGNALAFLSHGCGELTPGFQDERPDRCKKGAEPRCR